MLPFMGACGWAGLASVGCGTKCNTWLNVSVDSVPECRLLLTCSSGRSVKLQGTDGMGVRYGRFTLLGTDGMGVRYGRLTPLY